jgi:hypothetical protein
MDGAPSRPTDPPSCASTTILRADVPPILTKSPSGILGCMGITTFVAQAPQRVAPSIILDGCGCNFSPLPPKYLPHHKACGGPAAPRGRSLSHTPPIAPNCFHRLARAQLPALGAPLRCSTPCKESGRTTSRLWSLRPGILGMHSMATGKKTYVNSFVNGFGEGVRGVVSKE